MLSGESLEAAACAPVRRATWRRSSGMGWSPRQLPISTLARTLLEMLVGRVADDDIQAVAELSPKLPPSFEPAHARLPDPEQRFPITRSASRSRKSSWERAAPVRLAPEVESARPSPGAPLRCASLSSPDIARADYTLGALVERS
jgi:hypothetical protein